MHRICLLTLLLFVLWPAHAAEFRAGAAKVDITPEYPVRLSGYVARKTESEGVRLHLFAKTLAISQGEKDACLMITVDNCAVSKEIHDEIARRIESAHGIKPERIVIFSSHTHSAPALRGAINNIFAQDLPAEQDARIDQYTKDFTAKVVQAADEALKNLEPVRLAWGSGRAAFAKNRRTAGGPVDQDLPVLVVRGMKGELKAVLANYACHCTTLGGEFNFVHGDWAGVAGAEIEEANPGAVGMISIGCGADANPDPRGKVEDVNAHGREIAAEVQHLLNAPLTELTNRIEFRSADIRLPFDPLPSREEWAKRSMEQGIVGYHAKKNLARLDRGEKIPNELPYQVQSWNFGKQLEMVFLAGEVVVDYSLRLKKELDATRLWVSGYANFVPCYIPSVRILNEGGYEAETSLWYYDRPARLSTNTENLIISAAEKLVAADFKGEKAHVEFPPARTPRQSLAAIRTEPDLKVDLVAAEPFVVDPVAIDWAPDGKLWVVEMRDFPEGIDAHWKPGGRVKVLEDIDGDGIYDRATVFLDGVPFPTGITCWNGGALVCAAPDILFARDTDGDGKADEVRKLFSGFETNNFQARVNSLSLGLDNWFYGANGLIGGVITGGKLTSPVNIGNRDFRFHPESGDFETASGLTQQGRVRDDFDNWFGCDNSTLIWEYPLPESALRRNPHFAPPATRISIASGKDPNQLLPKSRLLERFNDPGAANRTTSACGLGIYRDTFLGLEFAGNAFVCEPVHNLVRRMELHPAGVPFEAVKPSAEKREFLASQDNWFRPVQARTGPDGALWIVDMYRLVVEHPRWITPERLKTLDLRAGENMGRIYRLYPNGKKPARIRDLQGMNPVALAQAMNDSNGTERDRLQLELLRAKGRDDAGAARVLREFTNPQHSGAIWVQALSAMQGLNQLTPADVMAALDAPDERVCAFAVSLAAQFPTNRDVEAKLLRLVAHPSLNVRFHLAMTLGNFQSREATLALAQLLQKASDTWTRSAALSSVTGRALDIAEQINPPQPELLRPLIRTGLAGNPADAARVLRFIGAENPSADLSLWQLETLEQVVLAVPRDRFASFSKAERKHLDGLLENAAKIATDDVAPAPARATALRALAHAPNTKVVSDRTYRTILTRGGDVPLLKAAAEAIVLRGESKSIFNAWPQMGPASRRAFISASLQRTELVPGLLAFLEKNGSANELSLNERQQLARHADAAIRAAAQRLSLSQTGSSREAILKNYQNIDLRSANEAHGSELFAANCATCHSFRGMGFPVGPNLAALTDRSTNFLLTAILNPNAAVENRYLSYTVETKDGRSLFGIIPEESVSSLLVVNANGARETVSRSDIASIRPSNLSLMPEGLEQSLPPAAMADLIAFLQFTPKPFGSPSADAAAKARADFRRTGSPVRIRSASERLPYGGWLGSLPMVACRQTDGQSHIEWESESERSEGEMRIFEFPAAFGFVSQPEGWFDLMINGRQALRFDATTTDQSWASADGSVQASYGVMQKNSEDSCGILRIKVRHSLLRPGPVTFNARGSASGSQRWFGLYELEPGATAAK